MFKDYYDLFEISQNATNEEIKKAFREQAIKWHPDRNQGVDTTARMQEINEAYLILKDFDARSRYDIEYIKFKQYQEEKNKKFAKVDTQENSSQTNSNYNQRNNQANKKQEYKDYKMEDEILEQWINNAKRQAIELAKQTIKDFKGVTKAAANGFVSGIIQLVIWVIIANLLFFIFKSCNH
jgi:curved DNA-binding protein CbpA